MRFWADGQLLKEQVASYGQSLGDEVYPALPDKEGYFAAWDCPALTDLRFDTDVTAVYTPYFAARASSLLRDGRPIFLVEGTFETDAALDIQPLDTAPEDAALTAGGRRVLETWHLRGMDDGHSAHNLRYLPPADAARVELYQRQNGCWTRLDVAENGSYRLAQVSGNDVELAVVSRPALGWIWPLAGAAIVLAAGGGLFHRKRKTRKQL